MGRGKGKDPEWQSRMGSCPFCANASEEMRRFLVLRNPLVRERSYPLRTMKNRTIGLLGLFLFGGSPGQGAPDEDLLEQGKILYNSAGSCVACHMEDGKGQPGSIPPLAGSDWLKGDSGAQRTIALTLRGLAGPIKVNGKRYYSAMPPQLLFDDKKMAAIISYVNNTWGNKERVVTEDEVAKARATLPQDVYTPDAILKTFPFDKKYRGKNGTFEPTFDDLLTNVTEPIVYRTFMPGASPAAFAVALPGNQYFCWDAGECRLRYVWTKGGFIRGNQVHWSSNGKPVAEFNGVPYYRARSSLLKPEDYEVLAATNRREPFYDTTQASDFPFEIKGVSERPRFRGYRLVDGFPEFRISVGEIEIRESIRTTSDGLGVVRSFSVSPATDLTLRLTPTDEAKITSSAGRVSEDGTLRVARADSAAFEVTIVEKNPATPATP